METKYIPKKSGGERKIFRLKPFEKEAFVAGVRLLNALQYIKFKNLPVHGFIQGRSIVTNAKLHVGYKYTLCMDIENFFDQCLGIVFKTKYPYVYIPVFHKWLYYAGQGIPTSPAIANLCFLQKDEDILTYCLDKGIVYSRYADDLFFSCSDLDVLKSAKQDIGDIVFYGGPPGDSFSINKAKTRILYAGRNGMQTRVICGVGVTRVGLTLGRKNKKRVRAAKHRISMNKFSNKTNKHKANGIIEFSKLKESKPVKPDHEQINNLLISIL